MKVREIEWKFQSHASFEDFHSVVYEGINPKGIKIYRCDRVLIKDGMPSRKGGTTHYEVNGVVYKTREKFNEVIRKL